MSKKRPNTEGPELAFPATAKKQKKAMLVVREHENPFRMEELFTRAEFEPEKSLCDALFILRLLTFFRTEDAEEAPIILVVADFCDQNKFFLVHLPGGVGGMWGKTVLREAADNHGVFAVGKADPNMAEEEEKGITNLKEARSSVSLAKMPFRLRAMVVSGVMEQLFTLFHQSANSYTSYATAEAAKKAAWNDAPNTTVLTLLPGD